MFTGAKTSVILAKDIFKKDPVFDFINADNPLK